MQYISIHNMFLIHLFTGSRLPAVRARRCRRRLLRWVRFAKHETQPTRNSVAKRQQRDDDNEASREDAI